MVFTMDGKSLPILNLCCIVMLPYLLSIQTGNHQSLAPELRIVLLLFQVYLKEIQLENPGSLNIHDIIGTSSCALCIVLERHFIRAKHI